MDKDKKKAKAIGIIRHFGNIHTCEIYEKKIAEKKLD